MARFFYNGPAAGIEERIEDTLKLVGMEDRADRPIKGFSGGERQRLGIAQAYVNHPELLILDEPAASLDPAGRRDVLDLMNKIRGKTTIFYSTHILDDVQRVSDIVAIMNHGELVAQAPIEELLCGKGNVPYNILMKGGDVAGREEKNIAAAVGVRGEADSAERPHGHAGERDRRREGRGLPAGRGPGLRRQGRGVRAQKAGAGGRVHERRGGEVAMTTENELTESDDYGPMAGFRNMMRKENARWWSLKSLAFQLVVWLVVLNALVAVLLFIVPAIDNSAASQQAANVSSEPVPAPSAADFPMLG